jgi:hypothetical protein
MSLLPSLYALDIYCFDQNNDTVAEKEKLTSYTLTMKINQITFIEERN